MFFTSIFILSCMGLECCKLEQIPLVYTTFTIMGTRSWHFEDIFGFCFWEIFSISTHVWKDFDSEMGMRCHKNGRTTTRDGKTPYWEREESCIENRDAQPHPDIPLTILWFWSTFPISSDILHSHDIKDSPHAW